MSPPAAANWEALSDPARRAVADLVALLAGGFTGKIEIDCSQGGVTNFRETRSRRGDELGRLAAPPTR